MEIKKIKNEALQLLLAGTALVLMALLTNPHESLQTQMRAKKLTNDSEPMTLNKAKTSHSKNAKKYFSIVSYQLRK